MSQGGWILCCFKNDKKGKVMSHEGKGHCYEVFFDSPIGKALNKASMTDQQYVLLSDIEGYANGNAFKKINSPDFHNLLNVGKDWVFKTFFCTGDEIVNDKTGATMQSFQTRLKKLDLSSLGLKFPVYRIVTHVTGCRKGKCYAFDVLNHFHLVKDSDVGALVQDEIVTSSYAKTDFLKDMNAILSDEDTYAEEFVTKEINAEAAYKKPRSMLVEVGGFSF